MVQKHQIDPPHNLKELVHNRLAGSPFITSRSLAVDVETNSVTLRGYVPSYYQKQLAQESIRDIEGIEKIQNKLEVVISPR